MQPKERQRGSPWRACPLGTHSESGFRGPRRCLRQHLHASSCAAALDVHGRHGDGDVDLRGPRRSRLDRSGCSGESVRRAHGIRARLRAGSLRDRPGIREGRDWRALAYGGFRGMGSFGNGAAMRVAPLGAYFADQPISIIAEQARLSAEVTHAHPEGIAGAVAVAIATALAWRRRGTQGPFGNGWIREVRDAVPRGYTFSAIDEALGLADSATIIDAAKALGNGSGVTAPDTVPLCLWVASRHSRDFAEALWETVSALGDRDTTCAIVGGILAVVCGTEGIPPAWLEAREKLPLLPPAAGLTRALQGTALARRC